MLNIELSVHGFPDSVDKRKYTLSSYAVICLVQCHIKSLAFGCLFRFEP